MNNNIMKHRGSNRDHMARKSKRFAIWPFIGKADPLCSELNGKSESSLSVRKISIVCEMFISVTNMWCKMDFSL